MFKFLVVMALLRAATSSPANLAINIDVNISSKNASSLGTQGKQLQPYLPKEGKNEARSLGKQQPCWGETCTSSAECCDEAPVCMQVNANGNHICVNPLGKDMPTTNSLGKKPEQEKPPCWGKDCTSSADCCGAAPHCNGGICHDRFAKAWWCFDPLTNVELENGAKVAVEELRLGDKVLSCQSPDQGDCGSRYLDTVTDVMVIEKGGPFSARTFVLENNRQINVTTPHVMYTYQRIAGKMAPVTTAAKDVKVNDLMMQQDGSLVKVTQVLDIELSRKVSVNTEGGSFFANGVLTTGMCEIQAENSLKTYVTSHKDFNNCILAAKDSPTLTEAIVHTCVTQSS